MESEKTLRSLTETTPKTTHRNYERVCGDEKKIAAFTQNQKTKKTEKSEIFSLSDKIPVSSGVPVVIGGSPFSNSFTDPNSYADRLRNSMQKKISEGRELNCNEILQFFQDEYKKLELGGYQIGGKHRKKIQMALLNPDLGTFRILKIIEYYLKHHSSIHRKADIIDKPSVDIMLAYVNVFFSEAIGEKITVGL